LEIRSKLSQPIAILKSFLLRTEPHDRACQQFSLLVIASLAAMASAAPQQLVQRPIAILRQAQDVDPSGSWTYSYETENGISASQTWRTRVIRSKRHSPSRASTRTRAPTASSTPCSTPLTRTASKPMAPTCPPRPPSRKPSRDPSNSTRGTRSLSKCNKDKCTQRAGNLSMDKFCTSSFIDLIKLDWFMYKFVFEFLLNRIFLTGASPTHSQNAR